MQIGTGGVFRLALAITVTTIAWSCAPRSEVGTGTFSLPGSLWRLVEFESSDDQIGTRRPEDPDRYSMELNADGTLSMQLDCNRGSGTWSATEAGAGSGTFEFGPLAVTRAFCPPPSMSDQVARDAESVRTYVVRGDRLYLNLMADGGNYVWERITELP
jgi:heat shock protein HslJ